MASRKFPNYLKMYRRRTNLSQDTLAFLLGAQGESKVSRYERGRRTPNLPTLLGYSLIFNAPLQELFAGSAEDVAITIHERAAQRRTQLRAKPGTPALAREIQFLDELILGLSPRKQSTS